jgi:nucleoside-diphosphate-sugar epimerase
MSGSAGFDPVLVTGGSGFVGACAVRELLSRGHEVHVLLRAQSDPWRLGSVLGQLRVHRGDVTDAAAVRAVLYGVRPRAVLHLATHGAYEKQADARAILRTNVLGTYNLLEASAEAGVAAFVNTGSSSEYGFKSEPMRETDRLEPNSFYAVGKAAQTHLCRLLATRSAMGIAVFRLFSVYGPWEEPSRLMPTLIRRARAGLPLEMVSPRTVRDFVYVADVLDALLNLSAVSQMRGPVINLGSGVETSMREVVDTVLDLLGSRSEVRWGAMAARQWDSTRWAADAAKAKALLGWQPRHTLRQGLARLAEWMEATGDYDGIAQRRAAG